MKNQNGVLILFAIGVFMAALDNGIISAALTTLLYDFGVSPSWGAWAITIYTLGIAISIPIVGKLSDSYGRKKLFLIEILIFGVGSLFVALSKTFEMLLIFRFIQSLGGGGIFIIASSHILSTFPKEKQGSALGALGGMNGIAAVLGPNIGAFILDMTGSWHWLFLINIPVAITLLAVGYFKIPESREETEVSLDYAGIIVLALAVFSFMYGLTNFKGVNFVESILDPQVYSFIGAGMLLFILLIIVERRIARKMGDPLLPLALMQRPNYLLTLLLGAFSGAILASVIFIPAYVEQVLGFSAGKAGYFFTPLALASGVGAGGGGVLVDRKGPIFTMVTASVLAVIGAILFPLWVIKTWQMIVASSVLGLGFGIMLGAPINVLATENTNKNKGVALGTVSLFRQIGMTIATTIYAGFIARSYMRIGSQMSANLEQAGIEASGMPHGGFEKLQGLDYRQLIDQVEQIPMPAIRETILHTIHDVVSKGYGNLYLATAVVAMITLVTTLILYKVRKGDKEIKAVKMEIDDVR